MRAFLFKARQIRPRRSWFKFFLIWPVVKAYRRRVRQSLSWRLAGSHHSTVLLTLLLVGAIIFVIVVGVTIAENNSNDSPANEARGVSKILETRGLASPDKLGSPETATVLGLLSRADVRSDTGENEFTLDVSVKDPGPVKPDYSIYVIDANQRIVSSSIEGFAPSISTDLSTAAPEVVTAALAGESETRRTRETASAISIEVGAYPIRGADGTIVGAVVVQRAAEDGSSLSHDAIGVIAGVAAGGIFFVLFFGVPAIPVAAFIGVRRARAISRPVKELAQTVGRFASGNLQARVEVKGEDEIAALGTSFNRMADQLESSLATEIAARTRAEQLLAANRDLVANVSHELRTPVALIRGHLEALENDPANVEEYTRISLRETDRLERLVNDLFQLVRLEHHIVKVDREPFDAGSAVREAVESLGEVARRTAGITMQSAVEGTDLACLGDRARMVQVLQNLIRNAIRFTPEGGIILVGAKATGEHIDLFVQDTGVGIAANDLPYVFDRFYRTDQSRNRSGGGAGLGLAIARELVRQMGGQIGVQSEPGEGSVFTIRVARAGVPAAAPPLEAVAATP